MPGVSGSERSSTLTVMFPPSPPYLGIVVIILILAAYDVCPVPVNYGFHRPGTEVHGGQYLRPAVMEAERIEGDIILPVHIPLRHGEDHSLAGPDELPRYIVIVHDDGPGGIGEVYLQDVIPVEVFIIQVLVRVVAVLVLYRPVV